MAWRDKPIVGQSTICIRNVAPRFDVSPTPTDPSLKLGRRNAPARGVERIVVDTADLGRDDLGHIVPDAEDLSGTTLEPTNRVVQGVKADTGFQVVDSVGVTPRTDTNSAKPPGV